MIQKVSLLLTFIFSSSLISIFELGFGTFCHRILKVKSQTLEETKVFSLDSAYFSLVFSVCQTWCLVFSLSDRMFGVFAVRHDVWCFSSQTRCLVFATHGVGWSLVWVGLPNVYSYYEAWGKPEQQASFMCFLIFHRPSGFVHLFLSVVFLFLAIITCHVKAQEGGSQTSCGKRRGWSQAQGCVRWADKLNVLVQRQASVPAGWSSRGHLFCSRLFFFCSELDKRRRLVVEDWAPSGKYNSRSRVPTLSCLSAAFLLWPPVGDLGLKEGFDFSSGCSCSESFLCCPLQRLYPAFFYTDIWVMSESNLICLSQIWNQKSAYLKHIPLRDKST